MSEPKTRVVVLTSVPRGFASVCLPALAGTPGIEVAMVVVCDGVIRRRWRHRWRKARKVLRIGPLGAINGLRMRRWYGEDLVERMGIPPIDDVAREMKIRVEHTPALADARTVDLFREAGADLALSLGNGFIPPRVFGVPRLGTINVHHELLPEMRGAQGVIWQLYNGSTRTGFTIHRVDARIDGGDILLRREVEMELRPTLGETVVETNVKLWTESAAALAEVVSDFCRYAECAKPQAAGRSYTTPSFWQYRRMVRQHGRLAAGRFV